jgi:RNA polymerase sigma factor (sigma-70 family)
MCNYRLVFWQAKKYPVVTGLTFMDLVQEGSLGLHHAIQKWDWRRGIRFSTYAVWWVKRSLNRCLGKGLVIRIPENAREQISRLKKVERDFLSTYARSPSEEELGNLLAIPSAEVRRLRSCMRVTYSLDNQCKNTDGEFRESTWLDRVSCQQGYTPSNYACHREVQEKVDDMVSALPQNEAHVLRGRFGLDYGGERSQEEIACELGRLNAYNQSHKRHVSYLRKRALARLKQGREHVLGDYLEMICEVEDCLDE